jgi:Kdo2-lipid IVA lauroyltransferase/acyltransferase
MSNLIYYLVFGFFYLVSLLPWFVIYVLSSGIAFLLRVVFGYRRKTIETSMRNSFPEKSEAEVQTLLRSFYTNFCDTWLEMIKLLSMSQKQLDNMVSFNLDVMHNLHKTYNHVQVFSGHYMNWELLQSSFALHQPYEFRAIYMPLSSKVFERLAFHIRSKFGTNLIPATNRSELETKLQPLPGTRYAAGVVADQSPPNLDNACWLKFLNQLSRGRYFFEAILITERPQDFTSRQLVLQYAALVEKSILNGPDVYLWSHRRWKIKYDAAKYQQAWIGPTIPDEASVA